MHSEKIFTVTQKCTQLDHKVYGKPWRKNAILIIRKMG